MRIRRELIIGSCVLIFFGSCHLSNERICVKVIIRCTNCVCMQNTWKWCLSNQKIFSRRDVYN